MSRCHSNIPRVMALVLCLAFVAAANADEQAVAEISKLEDQWNRAHLEGDLEALDLLWARDLVITVPRMDRMTKKDALQLWRSTKVKIDRYETTDLKITVQGDTAIATGRLRRSRDFGGRQAEDDWLFTKSYARVDGRWQVIAYHASSTPASPNP